MGVGFTFCHVFLNRQNAIAHQLVMQEIEEIVQVDTGQSLRWRHLHAQSIDEIDGMISQITADQHVGQAKGKSSPYFRIVILRYH